MSSHRIITIDNDEATQKYLGLKFQEVGYTVFVEGNAKEGFNCCFPTLHAYFHH